MGVNIGKINLTYNQILNSEILKSDKINGFLFWGDGECIVNSNSDLSEEEITQLKSDLNALLDSNPEEKSKLDQIPVSEVIEYFISAAKEKGINAVTLEDVEGKVPQKTEGDSQ